jgi:uncharacterized protein
VTMRDLRVSWDDYHRLIERLALQIHDSGWRFDAVICLARGGLRVGDVLSRLFHKPLGVMTTSSYRASAGTEQGRLTIGEFISAAEDVTTGRVLLADDLVDSGVTLQRVLPEMRRRHAGITELRTGVLWVKGQSTFLPDYHVEHLPTNPWIHQPFEAYETMNFEDLRGQVARQAKQGG